MKLENQLWGFHRIADELKMLVIILNTTTVNIIIQLTGSCIKFLK